LRQVKRELDDGSFEFLDSDEDIHTAIERRLTEITPAGAALHAGRSRNDQVALDLRLYCRAASAAAVSAIANVVEKLGAQAADHASWPMPGYSHLQRAQPVTLGHHVLVHAEPLLRDADRFRRAYDSADEISTGSSLMPQKKNPDVAELLRARSGRAIGSLVALATTMKGLPLAYDRDLQEDKPAVFAAVEGTLDSLEAAAILVERLRFDRDRIAAAANDPSLLATDAAEELVRAGTPFRRAHEKVGESVREGTL